MKKVYSGFRILICFGFVVAVSSCTADAPLESNAASAKTDAHKALPQYTTGKVEQIVANSEDADEIANGVSISSTQTEGEQIIDPDWKKLITGFIDSEGVVE